MIIPITIEGEIEIPDQLADRIEKAIQDNFVLGLPPMFCPPMAMRFISVRKREIQ